MANYLLGLILNQAYHNEPQILVPLLNLIYVKDLSEEITTNATLFTDDISFFSVVDNIKFRSN